VKVFLNRRHWQLAAFAVSTPKSFATPSQLMLVTVEFLMTAMQMVSFLVGMAGDDFLC